MRFTHLLCLLIGVFLTLRIAPVSEAHSSVVVVAITKSGFEPQEITVDANTTINFLNKDTADHWPASDLHPTHELYPEFDPQKPLKSGESWFFRANRLGKWRYHDHLSPHLRGMIIITLEPGSSAIISASPTTSSSSIGDKLKAFFAQIFTHFLRGLSQALRLPQPSPTPLPTVSEFKKFPASTQQKILETLTETKGATETWYYFLTAFGSESGTSGNIHDLAHLIGALLFKEKGFPALTTCTPQFAFGCFHGFLDSAFREDLSHLTEAEKACHTLGPGVSGPVASCIHGIGHGVASFYQTNNLTEALSTCKKLDPQSQTYCFDGVFMEFERAAPESFYKKDNLLYPCDSVTSEYVFACGRNQPQVLLKRFNKTYPEVTQICVDSKDQEFKRACIDSLGFIATSQSGGNGGKISESCSNFKDTNDRAACVKAAAGELIFQEVPGWETSAFSLCSDLTTPQKEDCIAYLNHLIREYGRTRRRAENEDPTSYIREQMAICYKNGGRDSCYKKVADLFSTQFPLKQTLAVFKQNENHPEIYTRCHEATHFLSRNEYKRTQSVPESYAQCDSTCHGGCYHGVLEEYLKETGLPPTAEAMTPEFQKVCGTVKDHATPLIFNECMHGLGHAAMFVTDMEIPASLTLCDAITNSDGRERCYSGIFMENSSSSTNTDHPGKYVKVNDPLYPCNALGEKYLEQCFRYQSSYFALITKHNWTAVANLCLSVPAPYQDSCFRTVGTNQVGFTQDLSLMRQNCYLMPPQFQGTCVAGVISSFAYRFVGDLARMSEFCSSVNPTHQPDCFRQLGTSVVDWTTNASERLAYCQKLNNPEQIAWCKQGAG